MNLRKAIIVSIIAALLFQFCMVVDAYRKSAAVPEDEQSVEEPYSQLLPPPEERITSAKRFPAHLDPAHMNRNFWFKVGECPMSPDGVKQYYCPSLNNDGRHVCIDDHQLCNGMKECPGAEDENRHYCLFYKALKAQVQLLERSVTTLNSEARKAPPRTYGNPFGRELYDK